MTLEPQTEEGRAILWRFGQTGAPGFDVMAGLRHREVVALVCKLEDAAAAAVAPPLGTRLVLVADDWLETLGTRNERGDRLSFEWGEPDEHGWYSPTVTQHFDDNIAALALEPS